MVMIGAWLFLSTSIVFSQDFLKTPSTPVLSPYRRRDRESNETEWFQVLANFCPTRTQYRNRCGSPQPSVDVDQDVLHMPITDSEDVTNHRASGDTLHVFLALREPVARLGIVLEEVVPKDGLQSTTDAAIVFQLIVKCLARLCILLEEFTCPRWIIIIRTMPCVTLHHPYTYRHRIFAPLQYAALAGQWNNLVRPYRKLPPCRFLIVAQ
uniref:Putative secreted protein n=1 Tax=Anopheles darlingi TaxID=43151 RepID=A0A2M4DBY7_ANODA